ncbi:MAG TPA: hypothetical protein VMO00_19925 [Methylomirabilota bacterium]|nr:hypothetical protein [Methylomirabilota bacterium]
MSQFIARAKIRIVFCADERYGFGSATCEAGSLSQASRDAETLGGGKAV